MSRARKKEERKVGGEGLKKGRREEEGKRSGKDTARARRTRLEENFQGSITFCVWRIIVRELFRYFSSSYLTAFRTSVRPRLEQYQDH